MIAPARREGDPHIAPLPPTASPGLSIAELDTTRNLFASFFASALLPLEAYSSQDGETYSTRAFQYAPHRERTRRARIS